MICLKKSIYSFFSFLMIVQVFAGSDREKRISELEKQMMEVGAYNRNQSFGAVFGPSRPSYIKAEVFVDLLLFKANIGATEFICNSPINTPFSTSISDISFDWDLGFRVGFTKENAYQECALALAYTFFSTKGREGHRKDLPSSFLALSSLLEPTFSIKSSYDFNYQNIDFELSKGYFISEKVLFYSYAGLKGCLLHQNQESFYSFALKNPTPLSFASKLKDKCSFLGIGPKVGFFSRWYIFKELSVVNKTGGALLYGYYKLKDRYNGEETQFVSEKAAPNFNNINLDGSFHSFCPYVETMLGLSWNRAIFKEKMILTLSCLYEVLYFWRQNKNLMGVGVYSQNEALINKQSLRFSKKAEDITLKGVSFEIELDF